MIDTCLKCDSVLEQSKVQIGDRTIQYTPQICHECKSNASPDVDKLIQEELNRKYLYPQQVVTRYSEVKTLIESDTSAVWSMGHEWSEQQKRVLDAMERFYRHHWAENGDFFKEAVNLFWPRFSQGIKESIDSDEGSPSGFRQDYEGYDLVCLTGFDPPHLSEWLRNQLYTLLFKLYDKESKVFILGRRAHDNSLHPALDERLANLIWEMCNDGKALYTNKGA